MMPLESRYDATGGTPRETVNLHITQLPPIHVPEVLAALNILRPAENLSVSITCTAPASLPKPTYSQN
jgi:hypothetical protein